MSVGTATAIGIIGGTVASIYAAHKASEAAKTASEQQAASADKALALQQQMYDTTRGDLAPYRVQGGQGLTALSSFLGMPASGATPPASPAAAAPAIPTAARPPTAFAGPPVGTAVPRGAAPLAALGGAPAAGSAYAPAPAAGGGMVLLRAPTGQTQLVPADQVDYYVARGATRG